MALEATNAATYEQLEHFLTGYFKDFVDKYREDMSAHPGAAALQVAYEEENEEA